MSQPHGALSRSVVRQIEALCAHFERAWKEGRKPKIEDYLGSFAGAERSELLRSLLSVEVELLSRQGITPDPAAYHDRFPGQSEVIEAAFKRALQKQGGTRGASSSETNVSQSGVQTTSYQPNAQAAAPAVGQHGPQPTKIGRFEILDVLGEGAFGRVYRARASRWPHGQVGDPRDFLPAQFFRPRLVAAARLANSRSVAWT